MTTRVDTPYSNGQAGDGSIQEYWGWRTMQPGDVLMRLTDVSIDNGWRWNEPVTFYVDLIDNAGVRVGGGTIQKYWGAYSPWVKLARFTRATRVRMRVRAHVTYTWNPIPNGDPAYYRRPMFNTWKSELQYQV